MRIESGPSGFWLGKRTIYMYIVFAHWIVSIENRTLNHHLLCATITLIPLFLVDVSCLLIGCTCILPPEWVLHPHLFHTPITLSFCPYSCLHFCINFCCRRLHWMWLSFYMIVVVCGPAVYLCSAQQIYGFLLFYLFLFFYFLFFYFAFL